MPKIIVEIDEAATKAAIDTHKRSMRIGRFISPVMLYRVMDGDEVKSVFGSAKIVGGAFSTSAERAYGAQWATTNPDTVADWGRNWAIPMRDHARLSNELFIAAIQGQGLEFATIQTHGLPLQGQVTVDTEDLCTTGLGCSVRVGLYDVVQWYIVLRNKIRAISDGWLEDHLHLLGHKARTVELCHVISFNSTMLTTNTFKTLQYEFVTHMYSRSVPLFMELAAAGLIKFRPIQTETLAKRLWSALPAQTWWFSSIDHATAYARPEKDAYLVEYRVRTRTVLQNHKALLTTNKLKPMNVFATHNDQFIQIHWF